MFGISIVKKEVKDTQVIDKLIEISQANIKNINERIEYLNKLKDNVAIVEKMQEQYRSIIDTLAKQTTQETEEETELNKTIESIKKEVSK